DRLRAEEGPRQQAGWSSRPERQGLHHGAGELEETAGGECGNSCEAPPAGEQVRPQPGDDQAQRRAEIVRAPRGHEIEGNLQRGERRPALGPERHAEAHARVPQVEAAGAEAVRSGEVAREIVVGARCVGNGRVGRRVADSEERIGVELALRSEGPIEKEGGAGYRHGEQGEPQRRYQRWSTTEGPAHFPPSSSPGPFSATPEHRGRLASSQRCRPPPWPPPLRRPPPGP